MGGVQVIVDYAHNAAALTALGALGTRRTIMAMALPGDRRDEDLIASIKATTAYADSYVIYDLADLRGRDRAEVFKLADSILPASTHRASAINQRDAIAQGWKLAKPADRLIVLADCVDEALGILDMLADSGPSVDVTCLSSAWQQELPVDPTIY